MSKGKYCRSTMGVEIFDLIFLSYFLSKKGSFCAHQKGNFLRFSKLTLLLSLVHSWCPLWPIKLKIAFFLGHPVDIIWWWCHSSDPLWTWYSNYSLSESTITEINQLYFIIYVVNLTHNKIDLMHNWQIFEFIINVHPC